VRRTPRIGVGYAGTWAEKPLRYVVDPAEFPTIGETGPERGPARRRP